MSKDSNKFEVSARVRITLGAGAVAAVALAAGYIGLQTEPSPMRVYECVPVIAIQPRQISPSPLTTNGPDEGQLEVLAEKRIAKTVIGCIADE